MKWDTSVAQLIFSAVIIYWKLLYYFRSRCGRNSENHWNVFIVASMFFKMLMTTTENVINTRMLIMPFVVSMKKLHGINK